MTTAASTAVVYSGPSMIDGQPIIAVVTGLARRTRNAKTGDMAQLWVLRADMSPLDAIKAGCDSTVCGNCPHRGQATGKRSCYVNVGQAPMAVWRGVQRGTAATMAPVNVSLALQRLNRPIRLGAYGDPAALPIAVIKQLCAFAPGWTGYTHQWRTCPELAPYVMASCDTFNDYLLATSIGWRTFRVLAPGEMADNGEIQCLSDAKGMTCAQCRRCNGLRSHQLHNVFIDVHGSGASNFSANRSTVVD